MLSKALKEMITSKTPIQELGEKYQIGNEKLEKYQYLLKEITSTSQAVWSNNEREFVKLYVNEAKQDYPDKISVFKSVADFLPNRSKDAVRIHYNRHIKNEPSPILQETSIDTPKPNSTKEEAEQFLHTLSTILQENSSLHSEVTYLKESLNELALKTSELNEKQQKLCRVLKKQRKLEKESTKLNQETLKKTRTILNYKKFGGVVEVDK